jgi:hypothetical protein
VSGHPETPRRRALRGLARLACALFLLVPAASALAAPQSQARVSARLSTGVVKLGSDVVLIATIENAAFSDVRPLPAVDGLRLGPWSAPSSRAMTSVINGRVTRSDERTWTAPVRPERKGEFTIPPLEFAVDGGIVRTPVLSLTVVEDLKGEELGHFELHASTSKVVEGEPFTIEMVFGWDAALGDRINWANLSLSWWGQLAGALENDPPPAAPGASLVEIVLNTTETVRVEQLPRKDVRGRPFRLFRLVRSFTPTRSGVLEFPTSWLEFSRIEDSGDIFSRRRERVESYFVKSEPVKIEVALLPEDGRPSDYGGAIGKFTVRATAIPRDVDAGESIKFKVEWSGRGNLEFFSPPEPSRSDAFNGFRVYGKTETKAFDRRIVVYDIAPRSAEVKEVPPLVLPVFDPASGRYTTVATEAIPINVRALARASGLSDPDSGPALQNDLRDVPSRLQDRGDLPRPGFYAVLAAFAALAVAWPLSVLAAKRRGDPWAPAARRRRRARKELERELAASQSARSDLEALQRFLAARTAENPEAWMGRDVGDWFASHAAEVPPAVVQDVQRLVGELEAAAWGGARRPSTRERAQRLALDLERGGL